MSGTRRFCVRLVESSSLRISMILRRLFYETALVVGAEIRLGSTVETVDTAAGTATLSDGTILQGDVILGCEWIAWGDPPNLDGGERRGRRGAHNRSQHVQCNRTEIPHPKRSYVRTRL
ncbi:hypothetical protein BDZ89DRAFT_784504 [Hymenopellis radicata]|nr:hypothetical protein BDZ89DRAFT_784504 [Hymenopellis radicata]